MRFPTSPCIHYFSKHHVWSSFLSHNCHAQTIIVAPGTSSGWTDRPDHPTLADLRSCQSTSASQKLLEPEGQGTDHGRPSKAQRNWFPNTGCKISASNQGCGLPLLTNSSTPAACRCWNKLAQILHWSLETEQREGRRCGGGWRGRIFFFLFANIQFHHWQVWQMETN